MLVESVHGDFLNVVCFPLNHFCKQLMQLYDPPWPEDLQCIKHGSIPAVDTFEDLSDVDEGGPAPALRDKAEAGVARDATAEAEGNRTCETLPPFPTRLLELINGFKTSKLLAPPASLGLWPHHCSLCLCLHVASSCVPASPSSTDPDSSQDPGQAWWLTAVIPSLWEAQALFTACKLKVFDLLKDEAPQKAAGIANKVDASVCGTERLLDFCAGLAFLEKSEQGCMGALAQELIRENPHLQVTVFDLPETIELAAHFQPAGPQAGQVRFAAGAGLLLVETLLDEEKREARVALLQSLNMLVQMGGRERSPGEYQRLLEQHGFCQVQVAHLGGILDAMLATRVGP
ncbi:putative bifunctional dTTP/UTP pyrophosphatase/methyltransferase protein isoform X2 [Callithrix jacchus]|uniref:probable bifunctional dTTP/UTP pyrophosphatase/methyltransferase protein isoform X2 n=1 Tax=Callithrix jacchus TaxID=9483 RepID=UPI0023DD4557|nr:probable bifunctional dTTP/UTP pyrophosphatase/methyltransferase protein isoform X2 [Callithrix jacchus]